MGDTTGSGQRKQNMLTCESGSTSTEYATILGVILVCLIVGVYCLGEISKSSFQMAATAINTGMSGSPVASDAASQRQAALTKDTTDNVPRWHILLLGAAFLMASLVPCLYIVWKSTRESPKSKEEATEVAAPVEAPTEEQQAFQKRQQIRRVFQNEMASLLEGHLKVRQIMSRQITCVRKSDSVLSVRDLMELKKIRHVFVSDEQNQLIGLISKSDCFSRAGKRAADIMTPNPIFSDVESDLAPAITMLVTKRISCLPITNGGRLEGVVTTTDFLMTLQCALQTLGSVAEHLELAKRPAKLPKAIRSGQLPRLDTGNQTVPATPVSCTPA